MECAMCGRVNQATTRFCAECGDVLRSDPPRGRRKRGSKRSRKVRERIHWVRVPTSPAPSVLATTATPSAMAIEARKGPARMMRRVDLLFAAVVCIAGVVAYIVYPYLSEGGQSSPVFPSASSVVAGPASVDAPDSAIADPPVKEDSALLSPAQPQIPPPSALPSLASNPGLDVVPPRSPPRARAEPSARPSTASRPPVSASRPSYAVSTAFGMESFGPPAAQAPTRVAAAPVRAPARKDRLQQLNDTIDGCASEGLLGRIACEQRALLSYCDGQWGKNERCPSGRTADYGN